MNMNFTPKMPSFETQSDCINLSFCEQQNITTADCMRGAHPTKRCTQGDFAQIKILSKILDRLEN